MSWLTQGSKLLFPMSSMGTYAKNLHCCASSAIEKASECLSQPKALLTRWLSPRFTNFEFGFVQNDQWWNMLTEHTWAGMEVKPTANRMWLCLNRAAELLIFVKSPGRHTGFSGVKGEGGGGGTFDLMERPECLDTRSWPSPFSTCIIPLRPSKMCCSQTCSESGYKEKSTG